MTAPDNHIEILIFPDTSQECSANIETCLERVNMVVNKYSKSYLWHVDKLMFDESCINGHADTFSYKKDSLPPYIYTSLCFGENVEDEWFTVYILFQVSKEIPTLVIRVWDSDGEFLLIEAADDLPQWCNPETCSERVFLYKGDVHIVQSDSKEAGADPDQESTNIKELLSLIRSNEDKTKASPQVQNDIKSKIQGYPEKIQAQIHHTHAYLPVSIAKILRAQPQLVAPATQAFCQRDALDMKAVKNFPHFSSEPKVTRRVQFTKCLYAMLMSSQYVHPSIPAASNSDHRTHAIGVKLTCGFEILLSRVQDKEGKCEKQWNQYLSSLHKKGYFKDLLEGSKEYKDLESMAREFYLKNQGSNVVQRTVGNDVLDLMQDSSLELDPEEPLLPADDDSWMCISSQDLDTLLQEKFGLSGHHCTDPAGRPDVVASAINRFLHHSSGLDGAEFPHRVEDQPSTDTTTLLDGTNKPSNPNSKSVKFSLDQDSTMEVSDTQPCDEEIDFKLDEFSAAITKMLDSLEQRGSGPDLGSDDSDSDLSGSDSDDYMKAMEQELSGTTLAQSFVKKDEDDTVDIDMNALQNVIASYEAQIGTAGPASNVLNPMGINIRALLEKKNSASSSKPVVHKK